jgi:transposase InsO family protein
MRILRFELRTLLSALSWVKPMSEGPRVCAGREARSRITDSASMERAIAGSTTAHMRISTINTVSVIISKRFLREQTEQWLKEYNEERSHDPLRDMTPREYLLNQKPEISGYSWPNRGRLTTGPEK